ncbi:MAG: hypothetical protein E7241_03005 [Lachnospiraceae bacterium]|nr:hypothetical protein [Lachnospiraceae bacterium]
MNTEEQINFLVELQSYANRGVTFRLRNKPATPEEIVKACVIEDKHGNYMRDYIWDDEGEVRELRFDKVINR